MTSEQFLKKFGHFIDAPNGFQKLRELILQLAVRGKLVAQDPDDEPASVLLENIARNRRKLIDSKATKAPPTLPALDYAELPFAIPKSWSWNHFADIGYIVRGVTFPASAKHTSPGDDLVACFRSGNVQQEVNWNDLLYIPATFVKNDAQYVRHGDILISMANSYALVGKVSLVTELKCPAVIGGFLGAIRSIGIDPHYLSVFLRAPWTQQKFRESSSQTTNIANISIGQTNGLPISIPPLTEQHRIVAKVDELMALCDKLEAEHNARNETHTRLIRAVHHPLTEAEDAASTATAWRRIRNNFADLYTTKEAVQALRQTILQLAVQGKLVAQNPSDDSAVASVRHIRNKKDQLILAGTLKKQKSISPFAEAGQPIVGLDGWAWSVFDDLVDVTGGITKGRKLQGRATTSYPYLRVANVQRGKLDLSVMKEIELPTEEFERYQLLPGDLLITEGGDWDKVGRTAIWSGEIDNCLHQNHVFRARLFHSLTDKHYLMLFLNSPVSREYFAKSSKQTTNLASINMTQLRSAPIPVPPLAEQHRIVAKVDELMALCDQLEAAITSRDDTASRYAEAVVQQLSAA